MLCESGQVRLNSQLARAGEILKPGDLIELWEDFAESARLLNSPSRVKLDVRYEDESVLLVNKPRELACLRQRESEEITLADLIASHCESCLHAGRDPREAGLVQRLDFFTEGLILAAKSRDVWEALHEAILSGKIQKSYLALVEGPAKKGKTLIDFALKSSSRGEKMLVRFKEKDETHQSVCEFISSEFVHGQPCSLVRVQAGRAQRHQVRAHLAAIGNPLLGDALYGARREFENFEGFYLLAESLSFNHPVSKTLMSFKLQRTF